MNFYKKYVNVIDKKRIDLKVMNIFKVAVGC